ncbi:putative helicase/DNA methylase domain protein [Helicobacter pylori Hp H-9]|nr:putative helicase/DNA methylase domain protein [Helicobacter pylori Hp H-9]
MGIDNLIVDEAHLFKNLAFETSMEKIAGLGNQQGSNRARDLFIKTSLLASKR